MSGLSDMGFFPARLFTDEINLKKLLFIFLYHEI